MNLEYLRNLALGSVATRQNLQSLNLLLRGQLRATTADTALCPGTSQAGAIDQLWKAGSAIGILDWQSGSL
jgi:hypothetical protein